MKIALSLVFTSKVARGLEYNPTIHLMWPVLMLRCITTFTTSKSHCLCLEMIVYLHTYNLVNQHFHIVPVEFKLFR